MDKKWATLGQLQLEEVAETSIVRRYLSRARNKAEDTADASENTMCAVAFLCSQPKEYTADSASVVGRCRFDPKQHLWTQHLEPHVVLMAVRLKKRQLEEKNQRFLIVTLE